MQAYFPVPSNSEVLNFAPEAEVRFFIEPLTNKYTTSDISGRDVDLALNIEKIDMPDDSFDTIICNHVLEHVNDKLALLELFRVLRPGGFLYLMIPLIEGWEHSYEDETIETSEDREIHFGQWDHVRYFGRDIRSRILAAG